MVIPQTSSINIFGIFTCSRLFLHRSRHLLSFCSITPCHLYHIVAVSPLPRLKYSFIIIIIIILPPFLYPSHVSYSFFLILLIQCTCLHNLIILLVSIYTHLQWYMIKQSHHLVSFFVCILSSFTLRGKERGIGLLCSESLDKLTLWSRMKVYIADAIIGWLECMNVDTADLFYLCCTFGAGHGII